MNEAIKSLQSIVGEGHVITDADALAPYQNDATGNYTGQAMAAVRPATTVEVSRIVKLANQLDMPIVPQGGNTGLTGATHTGSERARDCSFACPHECDPRNPPRGPACHCRGGGHIGKSAQSGRISMI